MNDPIRDLESSLGKLWSVKAPSGEKILVLTSAWVEALKTKGWRGDDPSEVNGNVGHFTDEKGVKWRFIVSDNVPAELKQSHGIKFPSTSPQGLNRAQRRADRALSRAPVRR